MLPTFKTEKEFREEWIAPFLSRMGFILPKNVHGRDEQGKDFFFGEFDRFGHLRLLAVQAKLGNIGVGTAVATLLDQIQRSFEVTLKYHKGVHEQRISAVYVMFTGTISPEAREQIWDQCRGRNYGENVYFLDGKTLMNIDHQCKSISDTEIRRVVSALMQELRFNSHMLRRLHEDFVSGRRGAKGFVLIALEESLKVPTALPNSDHARLLWHYLENISKRIQPLPNQELFEKCDFDSFDQVLSQARKYLDSVEIMAIEVLSRLDDKYAIEIEIVSV